VTRKKLLVEIVKWLTAVSFTLLLVACGSFGLDEEQLLQRARAYLEDEQYQAAAIEARNTLQKNPQNAEARYLLGVITLEYGDYITAEREFRHADLLGWGDGTARVGRARAMLELGEYESLVEHIDTDEAFSATVNADLLALRAAASAALEDYNGALEILAEATALDPSAFQVYMTRVQLRLDDNDLGAATAIIWDALERYPENPELLLLQAKIDLVEGNIFPGKQKLHTVIDSDPEGFMSIHGVNARLRLVEQLILEEDLETAKLTLAPLFGRTRNAPYTNYLGGLLAFDIGDYDLAEQRLLKVLKVAPDHEPTRLLFAIVNFAQQDYEQAAYFLSKYVAVNPEHLAARKLLGRSYMKLDQPGEARRALEPAMSDSTDDSELLVLVSLSALRSGDSAAGLAGLERALVMDSNKVTLRKELASIYMTTGETSLAIAELQELIDLGGDEQMALIIIGNLRNGEFDRAINSSLDLLSANPRNPVYISLAGNVFAASGDYLEARRYFQQALSVRPDFYPASMGLARLEELEGNVDRAVAIYRGLVESDIDSSVPVLALARIEGKQGNTQRVINLLQSASKEFPAEAGPRMLLAEHYLREQQYEKATLLLEESLQGNPDQPIALFLMARVLIATDRHKQAVSTLNRLLEIDPESVVSRLLLAEAHLQKGGIESSREILRKLILENPDNAAALALMAKIETLSGNLDAAMRYSQRIQSLYPDLYIGYLLQGDILVQRNNDTEAGRVYLLAWDRMRRSELAIRLAEVALRSEDKAAALDPLRQWLEDHPGDARVRRFLGATYLELGQNDAAIDEYERVLNANPDDVAVLNNLAWIYFRTDDPRGRSMAERAYRAAPENPGVLDTYGWILVQQGEVARGRQLLEEAREGLPDEPEVSYHLAVAMHLSGEQDSAREILEALVEVDRSFAASEQARQLLDEIGR
jgi:putative PEP-CTERM system TPR-repeat lipoprotein